MFPRLDVDLIEQNTSAQVVVYNSTASTNDIAWRYTTQKKYNGLAVLAELQTNGRGRRSNKWLAEKHQSILCSMLFMDCSCAAEIVTLAIPIAIVQTLNSFGVTNAKIKWPNDILVNNEKIAGVLIESRPSQSAVNYVVGIGINCHQTQDYFQNLNLITPATSIDIQTKKQTDRNKLAACLINSVTEWINKASESPDIIVNQWLRMSSQIGQRIELQYKGEIYSGHCIGVDPLAGLILQLDTGSVTIFEAAHTTIIKQNQY